MDVVVDGAHFVPRHALIRETLAWFDRYLGPVKWVTPDTWVWISARIHD